MSDQGSTRHSRPLLIEARHFAAVLRPLARLFLRSKHGFKSFMAVARQVFVEVAEEELRRVTGKINHSRLSALTGLTRAEVERALRQRETSLDQSAISIFQRIIGQWEQDARFTTAQGHPKILSFEGKESEFHQLVQSVQGHLSSGTVLFGLELSGLVTRTARGLRLEKAEDIPAGDASKVLDLLGQDIETLSEVITTNLVEGPSSTLHLRTEYDNVDCDKLEEIRAWFVAEGKALHKRARAYLARFDLDINANPQAQGGGKVVLGTFGIAVEPKEAKVAHATKNVDAPKRQAS